MLRINPEVRTTKPGRGIVNAGIAVAGLATALYGLHDGAFSHAAFSKFDAMHDSVTQNSQFPEISDLWLINYHSSQDLLNAGMPQGVDQALVFGGGAIGALSAVKAGVDFTPMTDGKRSKITAAANFAMLVGGSAALLAANANGGLGGTRTFDSTNDGVLHDPRFPNVGDMVLINGNNAESVFDAARMTGFYQAMLPIGFAAIATPFAAELPGAYAKVRKSSKRHSR